MWDFVYTVVLFGVFIGGWLISYARGYSAGYDSGFVDASRSVLRQTRNRRRQ